RVHLLHSAAAGDAEDYEGHGEPEQRDHQEGDMPGVLTRGGCDVDEEQERWDEQYEEATPAWRRRRRRGDRAAGRLHEAVLGDLGEVVEVDRKHMSSRGMRLRCSRRNLRLRSRLDNRVWPMAAIGDRYDHRVEFWTVLGRRPGSHLSAGAEAGAGRSTS